MGISDIVLAVGLVLMSAAPLVGTLACTLDDKGAESIPITHPSFYVSSVGVAVAGLSHGLTWWAVAGCAFAASCATATLWARSQRPLLDAVDALLAESGGTQTTTPMEL